MVATFDGNRNHSLFIDLMTKDQWLTVQTGTWLDLAMLGQAVLVQIIAVHTLQEQTC